jgi:hypothetical protein
VVVEFVAGVESGLDLVAWRPYGFGREMSAPTLSCRSRMFRRHSGSVSG